MFLNKNLFPLKDYLSEKGIRIKEVLCKNALTPSGITGMDYSLNPYIGCEHSCIYCYATFIRRWHKHQEEWGKIIEIKINLIERLIKELKKKKGTVCIGTVADPYQPIELEYQLTKKALQTLMKYQWPIEILTKSHLILRDLEILKDYQNLAIEITLTTLNERVRKIFEPKASSVEERKKAIRTLVEKGIYTTIFFGPIIPYFSDQEEKIREIFDFAQEVGVKEVLCDSLNYFKSKLKIILEKIAFNERAVTFYLNISKDYDGYKNNLRAKIIKISKDYRLPIKILF